jgi:hypothetical protein
MSLAPSGGAIGLAAAGATPEVVLSWATPAKPSPPTAGGSSAPNLTAVSQSTSRWRAGKKLPQLNPRATGAGHKSHGPPIGTTFALSLDKPATVTFGFTRLVPGRRTHGHCVRAKKHVAHWARCTLTIAAGTFSVRAPAGSDKVAFQGPITRARRLSPGSYRLKITAINATGQPSSVKTLTFTVIR